MNRNMLHKKYSPQKCYIKNSRLLNGLLKMETDTRLVATCEEMCPSSELLIHSMEPNAFECDMSGRFQNNLAIKKYARSAAGTIIEGCDVRTVPALMRTMKHIVSYVICQKTNTLNDTTELQMYNFVRDRLRSIRSDLTAQMATGPDAIHLLEMSLLFFIWAGTHFHDDEYFEAKQNGEQIQQTLLSLDELYDQYLDENGNNYKTEAFYRAISLITYLNNPGFMPKLMSFSKTIINSFYVQTVMDIYHAILKRDFNLFFLRMRDIPVQMAAYVLQNSQNMWAKTGYIMRKVFAKYPFSESFITQFLQYPKKDIGKWFKAFNVSPTQDQKYLTINTQAEIKINNLPSVVIPEYFEKKLNFNDINHFLSDASNIDYLKMSKKVLAQPVTAKRKFMDMATFDSLQNPSQISKSVENSHENVLSLAVHPETINTDDKESVLNPLDNTEIIAPKEELTVETQVKTDEQNLEDISNEPLSPPDIDIDVNSTQNISSQIEIIGEKGQSEEKYPSNTVSLLSVREIMSMIPFKLPLISYACVLLVADDNSESSSLALSRFGKSNNNVLFCQQYKNTNNTFFLLITTQKNKNGICSVLHCNETDDKSYFEKYYPTIKFYEKSSYSPYLAFNSALRYAIEAGITEIQPYNLSELVKLIIHKILQSMLSIKWRYASANSVIQVINKSFQAISTKLLDEDLLIKFILPFEHKELSFSDIQLYSNKILSMQLDMINLPKSRQCIPGSTWPKFFYENAKFTLQNFFVPMSVKFNQTLFINSVIECVDNQSPSETIYQ